MTYTVETQWFDTESLLPHVGASVQPDGWGNHSGELWVCDDWDAADWRLPTQHRGLHLAVNVEMTGRKVHVLEHGKWAKVRVRVTFVGDCEPDTEDRGWMFFNPWRDRANDNDNVVPHDVRFARRWNAAAVEANDNARNAESKAHELGRTLGQLLLAKKDAASETAAEAISEAVAKVQAEMSQQWELVKVSQTAASEFSRKARSLPSFPWE